MAVWQRPDAVLDRLDVTGEIAYLETSAWGNVHFYAGLGFEVVAAIERLPHDAPDTWCMQRVAVGPVSGRRTG